MTQYKIITFAQDNAKNKIMIAKKNIFAKYIAVS